MTVVCDKKRVNSENALAVSAPNRAKSKSKFTQAAHSLAKLISTATRNAGLAKYESPLRYKVFQEGDPLPDGTVATRQIRILQYGSKHTGPNGDLYYTWKGVPSVGASAKDEP